MKPYTFTIMILGLSFLGFILYKDLMLNSRQTQELEVKKLRHRA